MNFILSSQNALEYVAVRGLSKFEAGSQVQIQQKIAKNFNLLLTFPDGEQLLVKQERYQKNGKTKGEFLGEWRLHQLLNSFPQFTELRPWLPEILHFNIKDSIIVLKYLNNYCDLSQFYKNEQIYPTEIACSLGKMLADIHRTTINKSNYQNFFSHNSQEEKIASGYSYNPLKFVKQLQRIEPEIIGQVPSDGLKFFVLYQKYDSLRQAVVELIAAFQPCCLTHNDLKLNNILLLSDWEQAPNQNFASGERLVRLIDWERVSWGDPAFDLGNIISSYLRIWLDSLITNQAIDIKESLSLAKTPLGLVQPSIAALTTTYCQSFPEILEFRPDFLRRVVQFAGLGLIQSIQSRLQYQKFFGNRGICMLQVAKTLLCNPEQSIPTVFGVEQSHLTNSAVVINN